MKYTMEDFMIEAPSIALKNIENRKELTKKFVEIFTKKKYEKIFFVASGSSYNIANNAKYFIQKYLKVRVRTIWAYTFQNYDIDIVDDKTLVVFLSQSGHSTNTIAAARTLKERGMDAIACTNFPDSPLKNEVKAIMPYGSTLNDLFVAKGLIISTLFLMLASLEAALATEKVNQKAYDDVICQLTKAVHKLDESRELAVEFYNKNTKLCQQMYRVMIIGCGPTFGTALEGALKLEENYGCAATAFECDEFAHGPDMEVTKDTTVVYVDAANDALSHRRIVQCYKATKHLTDRNLLLTHDDTVTGDYVIHYKEEGIEDVIAVLYLVCPFQYWAHKICDDLRVTAWDREVTVFGDEMNTKVPGVRY